jgi:hypothetical protein
MREMEEQKRTALQSEVQPIVLKYKDLKKRKKRAIEDKDEENDSRGLKDIQQMEGNILHITKRSVDALSKGLDTYEHERDISATEKKDGAIEDFVDNSAKAASTYMKEMSEIPIDIAESLNIKSYRKRARKTLRRVSKAIRLFRI